MWDTHLLIKLPMHRVLNNFGLSTKYWLVSQVQLIRGLLYYCVMSDLLDSDNYNCTDWLFIIIFQTWLKHSIMLKCDYI